MRIMVEGLALTPEQPLPTRLRRAVPLPIPGRIQANLISLSRS